MARNLIWGAALFAAATLATAPVMAAEPSLHQVYQAAEAGKLGEAQSMMHEVLQAHPNSGKAHYVEAELLAKQGKNQQAETELATAERLAPGLPFAKPEAVQELKSRIGGAGSATSVRTRSELPAAAAPLQSPARESGFPWGMVLLGGALVAFIAWATRFMNRRNPVSAPAYAAPAPAGYGGNGFGASAGNGYGSGAVSQPYGAPYGQPAGQPYGMGQAAQGPGLGSRVMGGLATGAALGAGMVAGEALMHHFTDSKGETTHNTGLDQLGQVDLSPSLADNTYDMGGNDFGVSDDSSWDDSSSSDWS
ncbi:MAG TPA: tetratricopeptide repeat protein [Azospira sp.]|nr:tetratricopeptide repeat protein [Azospira sp.]